MADCKMGDTKETVEETQDRVSNNIMAIDHAEVEKEELSCPEATHPRNKELPHSNSTQAGKEVSSQFEASKFENKESLLRDHSQNTVATAKLHPEEDTDHPDIKGLELPKEGCSHGLTEPPVIILTQSIVPLEFDANNITDGNTSELRGSTLKADGTHPDPRNQSNSIVPSERSLETQAEYEMVQELKNGMIEMELDSETAMKKEELKNGKTGTHLLPVNEIKDKASPNGVSGMELPPENEIEYKVSPKEVHGMELPLENEIKQEESTAGDTEMKLLPNTEAKDEELHNVVTGTELPPGEIEGKLNNAVKGMGVLANNEIKEESPKHEFDVGEAVDIKSSNKSFLLEPNVTGGHESGTEEEQVAFMKELETFHKDRCLEFKPPRFYGEPLNCLRLWRAVIRLGGYEQVTSCKLWWQVGESFKPPKTCTTVSWTFRCFYEKALLEYEKHKMRSGGLPFTDASFTEPTSTGNQLGVHQASGSARARRDAAARAMQGWHSQRLLGNGGRCLKWKKQPPPNKIGGAAENHPRDEELKRKKAHDTSSERLLEGFTCLICKEVMTLTLTTPCDHNFCKGCLQGAFAGQRFVRERKCLGRRTLRSLKNVMKYHTCTTDISDFLAYLQVNKELMGVIERL